MQRTLVLLKPDALERGLVGEIISRLEGRGLRMAALKIMQVDAKVAKRLYRVHEEKHFFDELVQHITSGPVIAAIFHGENAVEVVRSAMGDTDPAEASLGTIRGDLAQDIGHNLIHGSDSEESAEVEIELFFSDEDILDPGSLNPDQGRGLGP